MKGASKGLTADWSEEVKAKGYESIKGVNDNENKEDDGEEVAADDDNEDEEDDDNNKEEDDDDDDEDDKEDAKFAANKLSEEIGRKPLPSALRSSKMGPIQSNLKKDNDEVDKQEVRTLREGGGYVNNSNYKWQVSNNNSKNEDDTGFSNTGQKTQACKTQSEAILTESRAEND